MPSRLDPHPKLPANIVPIYEVLSGEALALRERLILFRQLFSSNPKRIDLLNESGGMLFYALMGALADSFILTLSRMTDPPESMNRPNLSIPRLLREIDGAKDAEFKTRMRSEYRKVEAIVENLRTHRKKAVAHHDLLTNARTPVQAELPPLSMADIKAALEAVEALLNEFQKHYTETDFFFAWASTHNDGETLFRQLCKAKAYDRFVEKGVIPRDAWNAEWDEFCRSEHPTQQMPAKVTWSEPAEDPGDKTGGLT